MTWPTACANLVYMNRTLKPLHVRIDRDSCTDCGQCVGICRAEVFEMRDGEVTVAHERACTGCRKCIDVCVYDALSVTRAVAGEPGGAHPAGDSA